MRASIPTSRRVAFAVVDPRHRPQLGAHQRPGRGLLVGRVDLVERLAGDLVVDPLAVQLLGQRPLGEPPAGPGAGRPAGRDPGPGERLVVDQPDLLEPVEEPGGDVVRARSWRPACRRAPCGCAPGRSAGRAGSCGPPPPGRRRGPAAVVSSGVAVRPVPGRRAWSTRPPRPRRHRASRAVACPREGHQRVRCAIDRAVVEPSRPATVEPAAQKESTPIGSSESGASWSTCGPTPSFSRIFFSSSLARSGLSLRNLREFSLPWPSWSPS